MTASRHIAVRRGLIYGSGEVGFGRPGGPTFRPLKLDLYLPDSSGDELRPAVVFAFGGAFHRGSREDDTFEADGRRNTPVAEYCAWLAGLGYVAASIDYRLVPEDPAPGDTPTIAEAADIPTSRVAYVRTLLGLPPTTPEILRRGIEAATDDMAAAFRFVESRSEEWRIDPRRIAIGGFSAGARAALQAAFGEGISPAAVISLSGFMATSDLDRLLVGAPGEPPVLMITGEHDLDYIVDQAPEMARHLLVAGSPAASFRVPGAGHFYAKDSPTDAPDGATVAACLASFLSATLGSSPRPEPTRAWREAVT